MDDFLILIVSMPETGAAKKRRTELLHCTRTLDHLRAVLESESYYILSRTPLSYGLIPANTAQRWKEQASHTLENHKKSSNLIIFAKTS